MEPLLLFFDQPVIWAFLFISKTEVYDSFYWACIHMLPSHHVCKLEMPQ